MGRLVRLWLLCAGVTVLSAPVAAAPVPAGHADRLKEREKREADARDRAYYLSLSVDLPEADDADLWPVDCRTAEHQAARCRRLRAELDNLLAITVRAHTLTTYERVRYYDHAAAFYTEVAAAKLSLARVRAGQDPTGWHAWDVRARLDRLPVLVDAYFGEGFARSGVLPPVEELP